LWGRPENDFWEKAMSRTWIGAAAAASLATVAASALAFAQEKQPAQGAQAPASQRMESGQQGQAGQDRSEGDRAGQSAQTQTPTVESDQSQGTERRANRSQSSTSTRRVVEVIREGEPTQAMAPGRGRINPTEPQRRRLFETVHRQHLPEASVGAELSDGSTVPAEVTLEPAPQEVVAEVPMIERYRLFLVNDRVVLVDPDTREVIGVVR
jgi:hypothetical protein